MAFPVLSCGPDFSLPKKPLQNTISSGYEGGYEQKRKRFSRQIYEWPQKYPVLIAADRALLQAHIDNVGAVTIFSWTDPDGVVRNVRFVEVPEIAKAGPNHWSCEFTVREV